MPTPRTPARKAAPAKKPVAPRATPYAARKPTASAKAATPARATAAKPAVAKASSTATIATSSRAARPTQPMLGDLAAKARATHPGESATVLVAPYEERAILQAYGAKWDANVRQFLTFGPVRPELQRYVSQPLSWERWIEDEINGRVKPVRIEAKMTPRPHQREAAQLIEDAARRGYRGAVEADSVGLGKTLSGVLGAAAAAKVRGFTAVKPAKVLIIGPKSIIQHWRNTIRASGVDNLRVCVINYDQSLRLLSTPPDAARAKKQRTKNRNVSTKGTPNVRWDIIVADESHRLKNIDTAQRAKAFDRIARYAEAKERAPFVIWMSATVGQNPVEMGYLAPLMGQLAGKPKLTISQWGDYLMAEGYAVKANKVGHSWIKVKPEASAAERARVETIQQADIARITALLFAPKAPSIRRSPVDIAGWPEIQRIPVSVEFDAEQQRLYQEAWQEFRQQMLLLQRGSNPRGGLAVLTRFRQKSSLLMIPAAVDYVQDMLENGQQVAISCQFLETIDQMRPLIEKLGYRTAIFCGAQSAAARGVDREAERLRFQRGQAQVIFYTVTEAISLHAGELLPDGSHATTAPRANVVIDIRFTGWEGLQIEGRTHRDGQNAATHYMYGESTVQKRILREQLRRMRNTNQLSGDVEGETLATIRGILEAA